jgi:regulator of replication initiation timing
MSAEKEITEAEKFRSAIMAIFDQMSQTTPNLSGDRKIRKLEEELAETKYQLRHAKQTIEDLTSENNWLHAILFEASDQSPTPEVQVSQTTNKRGRRAKKEIAETPKTRSSKMAIRKRKNLM